MNKVLKLNEKWTSWGNSDVGLFTPLCFARYYGGTKSIPQLFDFVLFFSIYHHPVILVCLFLLFFVMTCYLCLFRAFVVYIWVILYRVEYDKSSINSRKHNPPRISFFLFNGASLLFCINYSLSFSLSTIHLSPRSYNDNNIASFI